MQSGWFQEEFEPIEPEQPKETEHEKPEASEGPGGVSRRRFLQGGFVAGVAAGMAAGGALAMSHREAHAQAAAVNPFGKPWWPSPWGPTDEAGASNRITPAKVLEATRLIKTGRIYSLGLVLEHASPGFATRRLTLMVPGGPTGGPFGEAKLMYNDDIVVGEIGQLGTQFDGLGHISTIIDGEPVYYNGFKQSEVGGAFGLKKLGIEHCKPFFTRGVLIDVLALKGGDRLPIGYVITPDDVRAALTRQGAREPGEGDVVLFRTGHIKLWMKDMAEFNKGTPGIGVTVAKWLIEKKVAVVGHDHWSGEAVPGENKNRPFECHQWLINMNGIHIQENLDLEAAAADRVYEFAYVFAPLRYKGATGSPGNPLAVI